MSVLEREFAFYKREKPRLLAEGGEGKYVLIKGEQIEGIFTSRQEGLRAGYERFGVGTPFFLHCIVADEPPVAIVTPFGLPWRQGRNCQPVELPNDRIG